MIFQVLILIYMSVYEIELRKICLCKYVIDSIMHIFLSKSMFEFVIFYTLMT